MTFYHWAMRNGAPILFTASVIIFVISFVSSFASMGMPNLGEFESEPPGTIGGAAGHLWMLFGFFGSAMSRAALTFFGACFLYRLDVQFLGGAAAK